MQSHNGFTHEKCQPDKPRPKHTPIPDEVRYLDSAGIYRPLPPDLDRLFHAAPKLAEVLGDCVNEWGKRDAFLLPAERAAIEAARAALKLLEEKP